MSISQFLRFVDIRTKFTSILPVLLGVFYTIYYFGTFNLLNTLLFFIAAVLLDFTTTSINVLVDYQTAASEEFKKEHNIIGRENISEKLVVVYIYIMLILYFILGLILVFRTNLVLLPIGIICSIIAITYTYGPLPISRMPLGELFSGPPLGFGIIFIAIFVNYRDSLILALNFQNSTFMLQGDWLTILAIFFVSLPQVLLISNIVLANNICDLKQDIENNRFTIVFHIGKEKSIQLYNWLTYGSYVLFLVPIFMGWLPLIMLLVYPTVFFAHKQVQLFNNKQEKAETFITSVKSFLAFTLVELLLFVVVISWAWLS
ncbi:UbiA family prenyltransferase [Marinilactibacillus psychrotolerans]|uniref:1,4-dihydroxy-2-naphthoate octaprenyltransferase n=1 Tax=Marinilactibacillus psychrotolerans TaxID=191770 RepID=A0AAV3WSY5_9LACT|nr:UbiA family prenyltransferase [Marinilactibacillus psychrotolerans]GEL66550.1 prenyltransferase [Marinilactibacillus psychrotolerans]GEQ35072.1 1,4-dihydroxy-2-naphthoate octaprenyltransferase [Marinilactibacillus psychrotolerans]SDD21204.1 1,4-dihydroxy-2-naphthoate prenyltransferase [Marinilactibacillus psychrotolerans]